MKKNNWLSKLFVILVLLFNYLPIIVVVVSFLQRFQVQQLGRLSRCNGIKALPQFADPALSQQLADSGILLLRAADPDRHGRRGRHGAAALPARRLLENVS